MQKLKTFLYIALSSTISIIGIYLIVMVLAPKTTQKMIENKSHTEKITKPIEIKRKLSDNEFLTQTNQETKCIKDEKIIDKSECFKHSVVKPVIPKVIQKKPTEKALTSSQWAYKQITTASLFVQLMYFVAFFALSFQLMQYFVLKNYPRNSSLYIYISQNRDTISDFTVNIPITGGVLATMFSFSEYSSLANNSMELMSVFKESVYDGVSTTLVGGMVYMVNMYLNIEIQKEIYDES